MAHIYKPEESWSTEIGFPSALAIGDSWFWYVNNNILGTMINHPRLDDNHRNIQLVGYNGARLNDYVADGKYADTVTYFLRRDFARGFSEFYISGAGNDAVDYGLALRHDCHGITSAAACIDENHMHEMLAGLRESLTKLVTSIRFAKRNDPPAPIFLHGYDYPVPDGRGFSFLMIHSGPWLAPAMNKHGVENDLALRMAIARIMIDRLNDDVLAPLANATPGLVHIDSRSILKSDGQYRDYWANELHPTNYGFRCIFEQAWLPKLAEHGIAK